MTTRSNPADPEPVLLTRREKDVVWLTLNRPQAMNAFDEALLRALSDRLTELAADPSIRVLVLTGAGQRAFCLGAEFRELDQTTPDTRRARFAELVPVFQRAIRQLAEFPVPVIAALNGHATGAGFDLALACDLRIGTPQVKLGSAFVGLGLVPDGGGTFHLPRLVGTGRALELILTAEPIDARTALEWGLLNRIVEADELEAAVGALAARLAQVPRLATVQARKLVRQAAAGDLPAALAAEAGAQLDCAASEEFADAARRLLQSGCMSTEA